MNMDDIKRALEAKRSFDEARGQELLKKKREIEASGVDLNEAREKAALIPKETPQIDPIAIKREDLQKFVAMLRQPIPTEWVQAHKNIQEMLNIFAGRVAEMREAINTAVTSEPLASLLKSLGEVSRNLNKIKAKTGEGTLISLLASNTIETYQFNTEATIRYFENHGLQNLNNNFAGRLLLPNVNFADFSQRTIERINETEDENERSALGSSLIVAQEELAQTTNVLEETPFVPAESDSELEVPRLISTFNVYDEVQLDLIKIERLPDEATYPLLLRFSSAASLANLTRELLYTLIRCNKTANLKGVTQIFTSTIQSVEAIVMLLGIIVRDEGALRDFILRLYMLIYEGAGDQKLRFLKDQGGYLDPTECDAIWNLKALRNKWLSHDPEHGKESDIKKSFRSLEEALQRLGFHRFPRESYEFESLQHRILNDLLAFLKTIEDRIALAG